jgi:hypothetical protein
MKLSQVKKTNNSENPFYGAKSLLLMQRELERITDENTDQRKVNGLLDLAWKDSNSKELRQLFFIIIFALGDIANREHNMFAKKTDQGGASKRKMFRQCLLWILNNAPEQFYLFLPIISEYTNYENLFYNQIRTDPKTKAVLSQERLPVDYDKISEFLREKVSNVKTTQFELQCIAKFLPKIPQTKRWRKNKKTGKTYSHIKRSVTLSKDANNIIFIKSICKAFDWNSSDYKKFRSKYLANTEAHLFSSKKICDFDKVEFLSWLESLSASARYRVQCRLLDKEGSKLVSKNKWKLVSGHDMATLYQDWILNKEIAMKKLTSLSEEDKKDMTKVELKQLQKQAKVTTGAQTIYDLFVELYSNESTLTITPELNVKLQFLVDKIKLDVPVMVVLDTSVSMRGKLPVKNVIVNRIQFAKLAAAIMLYKNPNPDLKSFMIKFNSSASIITDNTFEQTVIGKNRFVAKKQDVRVNYLVLKGKPFAETFRQLEQLIDTGGSTDLVSVCRLLKNWVDEDPLTKQLKVEAIQEYPVWLIISDGDLNNSRDATQSMAEFKQTMLQYFGFDPVVVIWDIKEETGSKISHFENIENVIHLTGLNPANINQVFLNISDMDVIDTYISLKTVHASNRYEPVRQLVN